MKNCPYCAEEIQDEAIYCRFCKHEIKEPSKALLTIGFAGLSIFAFLRNIIGLIQGLIIVVGFFGLISGEINLFWGCLIWFISLCALQLIVLGIAYLISKSTGLDRD